MGYCAIMANDNVGCPRQALRPLELQFLLSHTVHHYALIHFLLKSQGRDDAGPGFGIAPSTLRHHLEQSTCAR